MSKADRPSYPRTRKACSVCERSGGVMLRFARQLKEFGLKGDLAHAACIVNLQKNKGMDR